jgi:hypothetical protein
LWALVQGLPPDAVVWLDMRKEPEPEPESGPERRVAKDPAEIRAFMEKAGLIDKGGG